MVPMPTIRSAIGHSRTLPVFIAVITAAMAAHSVPSSIGQKFWHMRIDQRRVEHRLQLVLIASPLLIVDQLHR